MTSAAADGMSADEKNWPPDQSIVSAISAPAAHPLGQSAYPYARPRPRLSLALAGEARSYSFLCLRRVLSRSRVRSRNES